MIPLIIQATTCPVVHSLQYICKTHKRTHQTNQGASEESCQRFTKHFRIHGIRQKPCWWTCSVRQTSWSGRSHWNNSGRPWLWLQSSCWRHHNCETLIYFDELHEKLIKRELSLNLLTLPHSPVFNCDNIGATHLCSNPVFHSCMKHVALDYHFFQDHVQSGALHVAHVSLEVQLANTLTKSLPCKRFHKLKTKIRLSPRSSNS